MMHRTISESGAFAHYIFLKLINGIWKCTSQCCWKI